MLWPFTTSIFPVAARITVACLLYFGLLSLYTASIMVKASPDEGEKEMAHDEIAITLISLARSNQLKGK